MLYVVCVAYCMRVCVCVCVFVCVCVCVCVSEGVGVGSCALTSFSCSSPHPSLCTKNPKFCRGCISTYLIFQGTIFNAARLFIGYRGLLSTSTSSLQLPRRLACTFRAHVSQNQVIHAAHVLRHLHYAQEPIQFCCSFPIFTTTLHTFR